MTTAPTLLHRYAAMLRQTSVTVLEEDGSLSEYSRVLARIRRDLEAGRGVEACEAELGRIAEAVRRGRQASE